VNTTVDAALAEQLASFGVHWLGATTTVNGAGTAKITGYEASVNRRWTSCRVT